MYNQPPPQDAHLWPIGFTLIICLNLGLGKQSNHGSAWRDKELLKELDSELKETAIRNWKTGENNLSSTHFEEVMHTLTTGEAYQEQWEKVLWMGWHRRDGQTKEAAMAEIKKLKQELLGLDNAQGVGYRPAVSSYIRTHRAATATEINSAYAKHAINPLALQPQDKQRQSKADHETTSSRSDSTKKTRSAETVFGFCIGFVILLLVVNGYGLYSEVFHFLFLLVPTLVCIYALFSLTRIKQRSPSGNLGTTLRKYAVRTAGIAALLIVYHLLIIQFQEGKFVVSSITFPLIAMSVYQSIDLFFFIFISRPRREPFVTWHNTLARIRPNVFRIHQITVFLLLGSFIILIAANLGLFLPGMKYIMR